MQQNTSKQQKEGQTKQQLESVINGPSNEKLLEYFNQLNNEHKGSDYDKQTQNLVLEINKKFDENLKQNKIKISEKSEDLNIMTFNYKGQKWEEKTREFKLKEAQKMKKELESKLNQIESNIDVLGKQKEQKYKKSNSKDVDSLKNNNEPAIQEENKEEDLQKFVENIILERKELEKRRRQRVQEMLDNMKKQEQTIKEKEERELEEQLQQRRLQIEKNMEKIQERLNNREKEKEKFIQDLKDIQKNTPLYKKKELQEMQKAKEQEKQIQQKLQEQKEKFKPMNQEEIAQHIQKDKEIQEERQARFKQEKENLRKQLKDYIHKYEGSTEKYQEMKAEYIKLISSADTRKQHFEEVKQKKQQLQEKIKKKWENSDFIDENKKAELQKRIEYENIPAKQKISILKAHDKTYNFKEEKFKAKDLNKSALPENEYGAAYQQRDELDFKQQREKGKEYLKEINAINTEKYQKKKELLINTNGMNTPQAQSQKLLDQAKSVPKKDQKNASQSTISKRDSQFGQQRMNDSLLNEINEAERAENAIRRSKMIQSGNLNMVQAKQKIAYKHDKVNQWEDVLKDEKLTEQEKKQKVIEHAKKLESKAIRQEQLNKVKGKDEIKENETEQIDDLIVNSIKAKLAFIKQ